MLAALKWVLKNPAVDTAIIGITDFDELDEDVKAMSEPFRPEDERILAAHLEQIRPLYCRLCGACGGVCERGVRVADALRSLTYAEGYGQFALARETFLQLGGAPPALCRNCATCSIQCPNGVNVRARLLRASELFGAG
jgi:predicted aldo/keto reductase-like oxidoreductase